MMILDPLMRTVVATGLMSLRIAPVFLYAPPFSLMRIPVTVRVSLGLAIALCFVVNANLAQTIAPNQLASLIPLALRELLTGITVVLVFQATFAGLYFAGRIVDVQAGFGLSLLIDPTSRSQSPLIGSLFAYAAGALFFTMDGHHDLLRIWSASLDALPFGSTTLFASPQRLMAYMGSVFAVAIGAAGSSIIALFLADLAIAFLTRTVPQMNVLVFGLQVKTIVLLLVLSASFSVIGVIIVRLLRTMLQTLPELL